MKSLIYGIVIIFIGVLSFLGFEKSNSYPVFYDKNGQMTGNTVKLWGDTVVPTTANGQTIDISSAGFSVVKDIQITAQLNTATVGSMPLAMIKTYSTTSISVNILTQNSSVVSILGINVLSGLPLQFAASTTGIILHVRVLGY